MKYIEIPTKEWPLGSQCPVHERVHNSHGWYVCLLEDTKIGSDRMPEDSNLLHKYHKRTDHARDGVPLDDGWLCNCREVIAEHDRTILRKNNAEHWSRHLELMLDMKLEDGYPILKYVLETNPKLRDQLNQTIGYQ